MSSSMRRFIAIKFPLSLHRPKIPISPPGRSSFPFVFRRTFTSPRIPTESPSNLGSTSEPVQHLITISDIDNRSKDSRVLANPGDKIWSETSRSESRATRIREKLQELDPVELGIEDVSHHHAGHAGVRGRTDGETHFNLKIVSKGFEGMSLVKRHSVVYDLLMEELENGLHALSIVAKSPSELSR